LLATSDLVSCLELASHFPTTLTPEQKDALSRLSKLSKDQDLLALQRNESLSSAVQVVRSGQLRSEI
jgi:hypothetical protein